MIFISVKQSVDYTIEKGNILIALAKNGHTSAIADHMTSTVIILNGTILISWQLVGPIYIVKLRKHC